MKEEKKVKSNFSKLKRSMSDSDLPLKNTTDAEEFMEKQIIDLW